MILFIFSKTILKNKFKKYKLNIHIIIILKDQILSRYKIIETFSKFLKFPNNKYLKEISVYVFCGVK